MTVLVRQEEPSKKIMQKASLRPEVEAPVCLSRAGRSDPWTTRSRSRALAPCVGVILEMSAPSNLLCPFADRCSSRRRALVRFGLAFGFGFGLRLGLGLGIGLGLGLGLGTW